MARYVTTVRTPRPADEVFAYLADLRHLTEWDPGVRAVTQVEGDGGGPDSVFDVRVAGIGRDLTLRYRTVAFDAGTGLLVQATSAALTSTDRIRVEPDGSGCVVTYEADLALNGPLAAAGVLLGPVLRRIGDRAATGLRRVLDGQAA